MALFVMMPSLVVTTILAVLFLGESGLAGGVIGVMLIAAGLYPRLVRILVAMALAASGARQPERQAPQVGSIPRDLATWTGWPCTRKAEGGYSLGRK